MMKDSLLELLVCPLCHSSLVLRDAQRNEKEIIAGTLFCAKCNYDYKIIEGIPNMLPPENTD